MLTRDDIIKKSYVDVWNDLHKDFARNNKFKFDGWLEKFETIISNIKTKIIDLGCGVTGNNTIYLLKKGKKVISCDFAIEALNEIKKIKGSKILQFDMLDKFPFENNTTDLIIADLSLHYFKEEDTKRIISEIRRILNTNGYLFLRLNSTNSTEYKKIIEAGVMEIEHNLFFSNNMEKRFFDKKDIKKYFNSFKNIYLNEENMTRWCDDKIVWVCVFQKIKNN